MPDRIYIELDRTDAKRVADLLELELVDTTEGLEARYSRRDPVSDAIRAALASQESGEGEGWPAELTVGRETLAGRTTNMFLIPPGEVADRSAREFVAIRRYIPAPGGFPSEEELYPRFTMRLRLDGLRKWSVGEANAPGTDGVYSILRVEGDCDQELGGPFPAEGEFVVRLVDVEAAVESLAEDHMYSNVSAPEGCRDIEARFVKDETENTARVALEDAAPAIRAQERERVRGRLSKLQAKAREERERLPSTPRLHALTGQIWAYDEVLKVLAALGQSQEAS